MTDNVVELPEGFEPEFAPDGVHHFAFALRCIECDRVLTGEGNSPEEAKEEAIQYALEHECE